jgi:hypothetical protein
MDRSFAMLKKTLIATCLAAASLTALPAGAATTVWVRQAPPELRSEPTPPPREGFQWVPGYWDWRHGHHVWVPGTYVRERTGYVYSQPTWVEHNGRWQLRHGAWARHDRDHDGVPNGMDRAPNDPSRN